MHPSLWRATGIRGVLAIVGREGRSPVYGAPPPAPPVDDPGGALARRYLQVHGPDDAAAVPLLGRCSRCRTRSGCGRARASSRRSATGGCSPRTRRSTRRRRRARGCSRTWTRWRARRTARSSCPTTAVRKRIWASLGGPGMALVDGEVAGLWRPRKKGKRLVVELEPLRALKRRRAGGAGRRGRAPRPLPRRRDAASCRYSAEAPGRTRPRRGPSGPSAACPRSPSSSTASG